MKIIATRKENLLDKIMKGIKRLFKRDLIKNKIYSTLIMLIGYCSMLLANGDGTAFIFTLIIGLPIFFAKENCIDD